MFGPKKSVIWTSGKTSGKNAAKALAKEQEKMARKGYSLVSQLWAPEHKGRGILSTVVKGVIFLPLVVTGGGDNGHGTLTATFQLQTPVPPAPLAPVPLAPVPLAPVPLAPVPLAPAPAPAPAPILDGAATPQRCQSMDENARQCNLEFAHRGIHELAAPAIVAPTKLATDTWR